MAKKKVVEATDALSETEAGNLHFIVEQHNGGAITYADDEYFGSLVDKGYVEVNKELVEGDGYAGRPTEKGIKFVTDTIATDTTEAVSPAGAAPAFAIESGIEIPVSKRGGGGTGPRALRGSKYPFDSMEDGQSFFVPATDEFPNPAKTLASTASTFAKRYATENGTRTIKHKGVEKEVPAYDFSRKFVVRAVEENGVKGARVWRNDAAAE